MSITDNFFDAVYIPKKVNDYILEVVTKRADWHEQALDSYYFDFKIRLVLIKKWDKYNSSEPKAAAAVVPFSQMDADVLEKHWEKLKQLGGNPPPLWPAMNKPRLSAAPKP